MDLSIIIINYNSLEFISMCLESISLALSKRDAGGLIDYEIIVVDNCSDDGSLEYLKKLEKKSGDNSKTGAMTLIGCSENNGFSRASNLGADSSQGDYLLFLNPDTRLSTEGFSGVLSFLKEKNRGGKAGVLGVKTINPDGSLQYSCRSFPTLARQFYESYFLHRIFRRSRIFGSYFMTFWDHNQNREVDWLSGSFMLVRRSDFKKIGGFDEGYFIYSEDTDFCLRLRREGLINYYYSKYEIIHYDAGIAGKNMALREAQIWKSRRYYFKKNYSAAHSSVFSCLYFLYIINRITGFLFLVLCKKQKNRYRNRLTDYVNALKLYFSGS